MMVPLLRRGSHHVPGLESQPRRMRVMRSVFAEHGYCPRRAVLSPICATDSHGTWCQRSEFSLVWTSAVGRDAAHGGLGHSTRACLLAATDAGFHERDAVSHPVALECAGDADIGVCRKAPEVEGIDELDRGRQRISRQARLFRPAPRPCRPELPATPLRLSMLRRPFLALPSRCRPRGIRDH